METTQFTDFLSFMEESKSCFHAVKEMKKRLAMEGFTDLQESKHWTLEKGGKYMVTRNGSSLLAFRIGEEVERDYSFMIAASHSDAPTYKLKENVQKESGHCIQLNTEGYGGMIAASWLDRPLSIAGRVLIKTENGCCTKLVDFDKDMVMIPNLAIHMNRDINSSHSYNTAKDMVPLYTDERDADFLAELAKLLQVEKEAIVGHDLYLYNRMKPSVWGNGRFFSCGRIDDLECAYTTLQGFLQGGHRKSVQVFACFDNEEVGSGTKQGAASTFLQDVLLRIHEALGFTKEEFYMAIAHSMMLSADNAHAFHPNYPESYDKEHAVYMNEGVVVKFNANQKYTSDAISKGIFEVMCQKANVPLQYYANRSDMAGGSTLGNISTRQVSLHSVDIGLAQLAMHSSYETAGVKDIAYMIAAVRAFFTTYLVENEELSFELI